MLMGEYALATGKYSHAIYCVLPAYLIADLHDQLRIADSVFQLTNGFFDAREEADYLNEIWDGTSR